MKTTENNIPKSSERFFKDRRLPNVECRQSLRSDRVFKPHIHQSFSIGAVEEGSVLYKVKDEEAALIPGALALINPETLHSCNAETGDERSYYMLYVSPQYCIKIQQSLWQISSAVFFETIQLEDTFLYQQYITAMNCLMDSGMHLMKKEQLLVELLTAIFTRTCSPQNKHSNKKECIEKFKTLLSHDLHKDITIEETAAQLNMNGFTLLRQFKHQTGITPHAYRMNCRIEQARTYLQEGRDITDTALLCGFFDQSHFHRHFKAMTTVTPKEYQENFV